jgi:hypothetical protein
MAEAQKNVPIDETFHDQLKRIAIIDKTSMKNTVQKWIRKDGRGVEIPVKKQEKEESKHGDLLGAVFKENATPTQMMPTVSTAPKES